MVTLHQMNVYAYNCKDMIINRMTIQWPIDSVFQRSQINKLIIYITTFWMSKLHKKIIKDAIYCNLSPN